jgi:hypothetical protein
MVAKRPGRRSRQDGLARALMPILAHDHDYVESGMNADVIARKLESLQKRGSINSVDGAS